jgi:2-dehydro-3-deoxy-L-rhamnonate dehydrogenase (NAD+)
MNQLDLHGRHAVITGGATGLGYAIAQRTLASGGSVTLWDFDAAGMAKAVAALNAEATSLVGGWVGATGSASTAIATTIATATATAASTSAGVPRVHGVQVDVSRHASVVAAVAATTAHNPRVDILVNSAGITGPNTKVWDYPVDDWARVIDVNLNGLFHCCREIAPLMRQQNYGRIVNIASVAGKDGNPNASAYSASKAAVMALTKSLGKELADTGVRVNCVTPAAVKTAIFDQMSPEHIAFMLSKIPMGRFGTPEEVAALVCWLCTEDCSFSTGAVFDLSGGRSTY